ncbi:MAG: hypothetical protein OJI67_24390 [Prosthecobacter sp.]|nr:hypothetical protein [Prosthecobacter sp.]
MEKRNIILPAFTLQTRVSATKAKHDKIEFTMPLGTFRDIPATISIDEIAEPLGAPPNSDRSMSHADTASLYSVFFNRPTGARQSNYRTLSVRQEPISTLTELDERFSSIPLFSGALNLLARGVGTNRYVEAVYAANVNPTRFVRHQNWNNIRRHSRPSGLPPLFRDTLLPSEEFSMDGSDNWLPDPAIGAWQAFVQPSQWPNRLMDYFNELETAMRGEMARRGAISSLDTTGTLRFVASDAPWLIGKVEVYWEFREASSPEMLEAIDRAMISYSTLPHTRQEFARSHARQSRRGRQRESFNNVVLSVTSSPGVKIVIYPKTNERLRMEVRFDTADLASRSSLPKTASGAAGLVEALQTFNEAAQEALNAFLDHLERQLNPGFIAWSPPPTDLLFRIVSRCHSREAARSIINMLVTNGSVSRLKPLNPSIDALVKSKILERAKNQQRNQSNTFVPSLTYQMAVQRLREVVTTDVLIMERRERRAAPPVQN